MGCVVWMQPGEEHVQVYDDMHNEVTIDVKKSTFLHYVKTDKCWQ